MKSELGILTGKGIFCTIFATLILIICCIGASKHGASEYIPTFILVYVVWELYVNAYYSAELKRKKQIQELKTKMENEPYGSLLYNTYKNQYDNLINNEKLRKAVNTAKTLAMFAATHKAISDYNQKEMQKTKDLLDKTRNAIEELENRSLER